MKYKILFLFVMIGGIGFSTSYAHDSREAFFILTKKGNAVIVKAEFPWSIRNALFHFQPALEKKKEEKSIEAAFLEYVRLNFILKNNEGQSIPLISISKSKSEGHSHQTNYIFKFEQGTVCEVVNKMMFNINDHQMNHHIILNEDRSSEYFTSQIQPSFNVN